MPCRSDVQENSRWGKVAAVTTTSPPWGSFLRLPWLAGRTRVLGVVLGCVVAAAGIAMTLQAGLGVGPFDVLVSGLAFRLGVSFGVASVLMSTAAAIVGRVLGAHVGPGTFVSMLAVGPLIDAWRLVLPEPVHVVWQTALLVVGLVVLSLGLSLLIVARLGAGPVEVLMLGLSGRGLAMRWVRTIMEITFCVAGIVLGGQFGAGTIFIAVFVGHVIAFFVPRDTT